MRRDTTHRCFFAPCSLNALRAVMSHIVRVQVQAEFPNVDEVLFFGLRCIELVRERIAAEVVQQIVEARRVRCIDHEHVRPLRVPIGQIERLRFEPAACKSKTSTSEPGNHALPSRFPFLLIFATPFGSS